VTEREGDRESDRERVIERVTEREEVSRVQLKCDGTR